MYETVVATALPDVLIVTPRVFADQRGYFLESFNQRDFAAAIGAEPRFVQDNHSRSARNVLRGLHYQTQRPQGKLVRVARGDIFDVAVDMRRGSSHFGKWVGVHLSEASHHQMWIPPGFAHGFLVLSESADVLYKTTDYYAPEYERSLLWNDPAIGIVWPLSAEPMLSAKDRNAEPLAAIMPYS